MPATRADSLLLSSPTSCLLFSVERRAASKVHTRAALTCILPGTQHPSVKSTSLPFPSRPDQASPPLSLLADPLDSGRGAAADPHPHPLSGGKVEPASSGLSASCAHHCRRKRSWRVGERDLSLEEPPRCKESVNYRQTLTKTKIQTAALPGAAAGQPVFINWPIV